jgi:hypothetical protein
MQPMPDETDELQRAVDHARERLDDLSTLMVVANNLDQAAEIVLPPEGDAASQ